VDVVAVGMLEDEPDARQVAKPPRRRRINAASRSVVVGFPPR
jgi:hypothetical protein